MRTGRDGERKHGDQLVIIQIKNTSSFDEGSGDGASEKCSNSGYVLEENRELEIGALKKKRAVKNESKIDDED